MQLYRLGTKHNEVEELPPEEAVKQHSKNKTEPAKKNTHMVDPCKKGFSESFENLCNKHRIHLYFKGRLMKPC